MTAHHTMTATLVPNPRQTFVSQPNANDELVRKPVFRSARAPSDILVEQACSKISRLASDEVWVRRGGYASGSAFVRKGFLFQTIETTGGRAIVGIQIPGDFVSLQNYNDQPIDHSIVAAGNVELAVVSHRAMEALIDHDSNTMRYLWRATQREATLQRTWIQILEQLDAPQRIAHIYCELKTRMELTGKSVRHALRAPFSQLDLGDMCGISTVHANRAVSKLRECGLADIRRGTLYTDNWSELQRYAEFDPQYLYTV